MGDWWGWSYLLALVGCTGFLLAGRKVWWSWWVNVGCQALWAAYAVSTQQWGFLVSVPIYLAVFIPNAIKWTRERNEEKNGGKYHRFPHFDEYTHFLGYDESATSCGLVLLNISETVTYTSRWEDVTCPGCHAERAVKQHIADREAYLSADPVNNGPLAHFGVVDMPGGGFQVYKIAPLLSQLRKEDLTDHGIGHLRAQIMQEMYSAPRRTPDREHDRPVEWINSLDIISWAHFSWEKDDEFRDRTCFQHPVTGEWYWIDYDARDEAGGKYPLRKCYRHHRYTPIGERGK